MNKKILAVIIIVLGLGLIGFIVYYFYFSNPTPAPTASTKPPVTEKNLPIVKKIDTTNSTSTAAKAVPAAVPGEVAASRLAGSFAEFFGSYSNQGDLTNLTMAEVMMSAKFKAWAENNIKTQRATDRANQEFYSISTRAISTDLKKFDDSAGMAQAVVTVQRRETKGAGAPVTWQQSLIISLIKESGSWKVDKAEWGK